jgi:hypothetical protein
MSLASHIFRSVLYTHPANLARYPNSIMKALHPPHPRPRPRQRPYLHPPWICSVHCKAVSLSTPTSSP